MGKCYSFLFGGHNDESCGLIRTPRFSQQFGYVGKQIYALFSMEGKANERLAPFFAMVSNEQTCLCPSRLRSLRIPYRAEQNCHRGMSRLIVAASNWSIK